MAEIEKTALPYRPCVGIMLLNDQGAVFAGQRVDTTAEAWQMPQGGIDDGESPRDAAYRELEEEIGTAKADILAETPEWLYYDLPDHLIGQVWGGRYRGQAQKWFAMRFLGTDADIDLDAHHREFNDWRWVTPAELPDLIVPFKRPIYDRLLAEFAPIIARLRGE